MRIAWVGPMPTQEGGAGGVSNQLLCELDRMGVVVDCYVPGDEEALPTNLVDLKNVRFICGPSGWEWGRWYSRNRLLSFITGQMANLRSENRLARVLVMNHRAKPYDLIYQFSHIEFSTLRRFRSALPVIVLHPSVHAAGELRSLRAEKHLSKVAEPMFMRVGARILLAVRAIVQRRHVHIADFILSISRNFASDLVHDYSVPEHKIRILSNPVDIHKFAPSASSQRQGRLVILFVSRISVRKGVEMVVELSHRLQDLRDMVEIQVVGDKSLWSDYTQLLLGLNPVIARYMGPVAASNGAIQRLYQNSDMLVQPSHYEPFGLTVAEALSSGLPVVVSDKIGAAEGVHHIACRIHKDGDVDAMEREVRQLVSELMDDRKRERISHMARSEAKRIYSTAVVGSQLIRCLVEFHHHDRATDAYFDRVPRNVSQYTDCRASLKSGHVTKTEEGVR